MAESIRTAGYKIFFTIFCVKVETEITTVLAIV